jgi:hypothetical protein
MVTKIKVSPEIARLTQRRASRYELSFAKQLAYCIAEQAVLELDPQLGFVLDNENSLAEVDALVRAVQVNDIVVNGRHIDVSVLREGIVEVHKAVVHTPYMECGSLVVRLDGPSTGSVVGHIQGKSFAQAADMDGATHATIRLAFTANENFDLAACLQQIERNHKANIDRPAEELPKAEDYLQFSRDQQKLSLEKQRSVVAAALSSPAVRKNIGVLSNFIVDTAPRVLRDSAVWELRSANIVDKLKSSFPSIPEARIQEMVAKIGERFGGQSESPLFREELLKSLAQKEISAKVSADVKPKLDNLIAKVLAGRNKVDAIKEFVKNQVAVEVGRMIGEQRDVYRQFARASKEEIGFAFQQLAVQPAYATHSQPENTALDAINEALQLYEAANIVEEAMALEF